MAFGRVAVCGSGKGGIFGTSSVRPSYCVQAQRIGQGRVEGEDHLGGLRRAFLMLGKP